MTVYPYDTDDQVDGVENNFLYYETDTVRGSSGSPVLNDQWYVVALHRRGVPAVRQRNGTAAVVRRDNRLARPGDDEEQIRYVSNEGIRISRIIARLRELATGEPSLVSDAAARAEDIIAGAAGMIDDGPIATPTAVPTVYTPTHFGGRSSISVESLEALEIGRRSIEQFPESLGYDADFLPGFTIPLPRPKATLTRQLARRLDQPDEYLLPFRHFTTAMHARRRLPIFAAVNVDGKRRQQGGMGGRPSWSYDPRIAEEHQPDDSIFSNLLQRGHLAAREYVVFGTPTERRQADVHSFTLTNVCPQVRAFNGGRGEWYRVERNVMSAAHGERARLTEFVGPILRASDPTFDSRQGPNSDAAFHTRIRIPLLFWKIVFWVEEESLLYRAFLLDQSEELDDAGPLELDIATPDGVTESSIEEIAALTDLEFDIA